MQRDTTATAINNSSDIDTHTISITWLSAAAIAAVRQEKLSLPQLAHRILSTTVLKNSDLPWFSLHDYQLVEVSGINAQCGSAFEPACELVRKNKIRALIFQNPTTPPTLQIIVPFSESMSPEKLPALAARLNGVFRGKLAAESFDPTAQCRYGSVGTQNIEINDIDGDFIDLRADLDAGAIDHDPELDVGDSDDIKRLNANHAILPIGGKTRVVTFGELEEFPGRQTIIMTQTVGDFAALMNKYRHRYTNDKGEEKTVPMGNYWVGSQYRRQYDDGMAFMPQPDKKRVYSKLNLWRGYGVKSVKPDGKSGAAGCNKFLDFMLKVICGGNEQHFDYLRKREATILQRRIRTEIAIGLHTEEEGVGKGFYESKMSHLLGSHAMRVTNPKHVIGAFNPHLETLLRLTADEALFVGNHEHRNALFGLITDTPLTIEPKGCGVYNAENFLNISVLSNSPHFVPVSGTARRFFIPTLSTEHMQDFKYFEAIEHQLRNEGGFESLLFNLLNEVDLTDFNVRDVPKTAGLVEQAALGRRGVDGLVEEACSYGRVPCEHWLWPGCTVTSGTESGLGFFVYIDNHRDRELSPLGAHKVIKRLVKKWNCCALGQQRDPSSGKRITALKWPSLEDLRKLFVERFGEQEWLHPEVSEWKPSGQPFPQ